MPALAFGAAPLAAVAATTLAARVGSAQPPVRTALTPAPAPIDYTTRAAQPPARATVRLSGYVRNAATREVVRYVTLSASALAAPPNTNAAPSAAPGGAAINTQTGADGAYFLRLAPGRYRLRARAIGFAPLDTVVAIEISPTGTGARAPTNSLTLHLALRPQAATLAAVQVTAGTDRPDADPRSATMGTARIDLRTVRQTPAVLGEVDPIRSLTLLPGVSRTSDFNTAFNVRGGGADQNLILLDEATIYNAAHVLGFLSVFNADAVDDVTLHKGAIPTRYGGRLSSVVDIRQRAGNATRLGGSATVGLLASRAVLEGPLPGTGGSFIVAGRRSYADAFTRASSDPDVRETVAYFYDVNGKATLPVGRTGTVALSGYLGRDRFSTAATTGAGWGNRAATLRWDQIVGGRLLSKVTVAGSEYDYRLTFPIGADPVDWVARIRSLDVRVDQALTLGQGHTLEFGAQATALGVRPGAVTATGDDEGAGLAGRRVEPRRALSGALYVGHEVDLGPRVSVRYGARLSAFVQRGPSTVYAYAGGRPVAYDSALGRLEPGRVVDSVRVRGTIADYATLEPRASVRFGLTPNSSLKLGYARTAQYLHLASRTNSPTPLDVWEPSGRYLRPQRADQLALGYAATIGGAYELSAEVYGKRLTDVVDFVDGVDLVLNPRVESAIVQGLGRAAGLELFARRRTGRVTGWVSYTLSRAEQRFGTVPGAGPEAAVNGGRWYRAPYDKTHDLSVVALRPLGAGWTLGATFALASGLPATYPVARYQVDGLLVPEFGARNAARLPLYHRLDLGVTRATRRGELQLGVINAYNRYNAQSISFRQAERNPLVSEAVQLSVFGIVPSVSYTRRF